MTEDQDKMGGGDDREARGDDVEGHAIEQIDYQGDRPSEGMERASDEADVEGHAMTGAVTPHISPRPSESASE